MNKTMDFISFRKISEERESQVLHPKASLSRDHSRNYGMEDDHRLPYKRDVDRIIHSKAYARYIDKTQVVYLVENDHVTHRGLHVQLVSNFARGIAEILRLNLDLVEAISLGHDVGHPPFGHEGEGYLSAITQKYKMGHFAHSEQSCRLLSEIEPLNLGLAVYDGFLCHDGGFSGTKLVPQFDKTWSDHFEERKSKKANPDINIMPGTLEGCLVKLCDTVSYLGRDIEDAIQLGILQREELPETILGSSNRELLSTVAKDIILNSYDKDYIAISEDIYEALRAIRRFNFEKIYIHPKLKMESKKIERGYNYLFDVLLEDFQKNHETSLLWMSYASNKSEKYKTSTLPHQMVTDYISGMTDNFFVRSLEKLIIPSQIELS
jgi:dGTPase